MNIPSVLHEWQLSPSDAKQLQKDLVKDLRDEPLDLSQVRYVAGVDVGVKERDGIMISQAAIVICTFPEMHIVETVRAHRPTDYPYVPGLLTFREGPVLLQAWAQVQTDPDVLMFDGMGRIHPRQMGIAAHMGLWLQRPTMGCGKTHFLGDYDTPALERGSYSVLTVGGQARGVVLRTRNKVKPVYISAGHRMDTAGALALTLACTTKYRLPQPIRYAHDAAGKAPG